MELAELYERIGGSMENLFGRFGNETRVKRFLGLFLKDPSFAELQAAAEAGDWAAAFRAAHTLKGVTANMNFTRLTHSASALTEALRGGKTLEDRALLDAVCEDYRLVESTVREYLAAAP